MKRWREDTDVHAELRRVGRILIDTECMWEICQQRVALSVGDQKTASLFYFILSTLHPCVAQVASASQNTHYHILLKHSCFNYLIN